MADDNEQEFDFSDIILTGAEPGDAPIVADENSVDWEKFEEGLKEQEKFADKGGEALLQSAASAATFSLSDRLQDAMGIKSAEELRKLREYNPGADVAGTVLGTVAPLVVSGPAAVLGAPVKAAAKAGQAVEKAILKATTDKALKGTAQEVLRKSAAKGLGSSVEGAAFGMGTLLREDALGEAEINAENVLSHAGTGAVLGGVLGVGLPAAAKATSVAARKTGKLAKDTFGPMARKIVDPAEDAMELLGYSPKMKARVLTNEAEKKTVADLPRWLKEDVGWQIGDNEQTRLNKLMQLGESSGQTIDDIMRQADEALLAKYTPEQVRMTRTEIFRRVADDLERETLERLGTIPSANPARRRLSKLVRNLRSYADTGAASKSTTKFSKELRQLRNEIWDTYKSLPMEEKGTQVGSILKNGYGKMAQSLEAFAEAADSGLAEKLRKANQNFSRYKRYEEPLARRTAKDKNFVSFRDVLFGGIGYGAGGVPGVLAAGARKLLNSDVKRMVTVLSSIEKSNKEAQKAITGSVDNFFKANRLPGLKAGSINALLSTDYSSERKNRKQAYKEVEKNLRSIALDPEALGSHVARATSVLSAAAPQTAVAAAEKLGAGIQFLYSKLPKPATDVKALGSAREYEPSSMELAKFERYLQAVERPLSVLKDLEQGTLTREHVEALAAVYPRLLQQIREQTMQKLTEGETVPYNRRVQLGILLDLPSDPSLEAQAVLGLQANFEPPAEPSQAPKTAVNPTVGGLKELNMADRAQTEPQRVAAKEEP